MFRVSKNSCRNNLFFIDLLFKWTLRRALLYTAEHLGNAEIFFYLCLQNKSKLAHRKNEILVLFCAISARDMFTIHGIKISSFVYVKHPFLDISIKRQLESNSCFLFNKSKTSPFFKKKNVFLYISTKKNQQKNTLKVCNHNLL